LWKFSIALGKVLYAPATVYGKEELALLPEEKRSCLWVAVMEGKKGEGSFRPFFPLSDKEREVIPEGGLPIVENRRGAEDFFKTGIVRKLAGRDPPRWNKPLHVMSAAMLLAFSFCGEDGSEFADELWREDPNLPLTLKNGDPRLMGLGRKFAGYVRHFDALKAIETRTSDDSNRELQDGGYTRKRRIEFPVGLLGDVEYSVTFFEREDGRMALGCKPRAATLRHKGDLIYSLPVSVYEQALIHDTLDGAPDDYFTVTQLTSAKGFERWAGNVNLYVPSLTGAV
jgi:hypothetical protein